MLIEKAYFAPEDRILNQYGRGYATTPERKTPKQMLIEKAYFAPERDLRAFDLVKAQEVKKVKKEGSIL